MTIELHQFGKGLELYNQALLTTTTGEKIEPEKLLEQMKLMFDLKREAGQVPEVYENPIGAQLELTTRCNQRCLQCYNNSGVDNKSEDTMTLEDWKEVAHELGKMNLMQCVISGGEPTLMGDGLFEIMDILHSYDIRFIFISNGMLINEEKMEKLAKYRYQWFQISIDGSRPEIHDEIRGVKSWHQALHAARLVKQAGIPLVIAHTVMNLNYEYLDEMIEMAHLLGAYRITLGPYLSTGRSVTNYKKIELSEEQVQKAYELAERKKREYDKKMEIMISPEEPISYRVRTLEPNGVILVRPNGDIKFDCIAPFVLGNLKEQSIKDIWLSVGQRAWQHPRVLEYILAIKKREDMLTVSPRTYVDPDERLQPINL